jgi:hypothetical protein
MPKKKIIRKRKAKKRVKKFLKSTLTPELKQEHELDIGIGFDAGLGSDAWLINQSRKRGKK